MRLKKINFILKTFQNSCIEDTDKTHAIYMSQRVVRGTYRGVVKSLGRPGRKQANVSVRMA